MPKYENLPIFTSLINGKAFFYKHSLNFHLSIKKSGIKVGTLNLAYGALPFKKCIQMKSAFMYNIKIWAIQKYKTQICLLNSTQKDSI